jgi:hypothetical protein
MVFPDFVCAGGCLRRKNTYFFIKVERFQAKWEPVRRPETRQTKTQMRSPFP